MQKKIQREARAAGRESHATAMITAILFLAILFAGGILFWILPDKARSEQENRTLQQLPTFSFARFFDGTFGEEMNDYYADQFPARDFLVGVKGVSEYALGKGANNGVLLGEDGQLAQYLFTAYRADGSMTSDTDCFDPETVSAGCAAIGRLQKTLAQEDIDLTVLIPPRTLDVTISAFSLSSDGSDTLHDTLYAALDRQLDGSENVVDMTAFYREKYAAGEYVYYKTDHHWTTRGAYYAYETLMRTWGRESEILPQDAFYQTQTADFYGTAWSRSGFKFVAPDTLELWLRGNESDFVTADPKSGTSFSGFYNMSYLEEKDKYSAFFDGTHSLLTVTRKDGTARERVLVVKDSFANSVMPFLAQHFDLVVLNLSGSGDETRVSQYAREYDCDRVLLLYNLENIVSSPRLSRVK